MTTIERIPYYRNFENDFPKEIKEERSTTERIMRITQAALPFFSLYRPLGFAITLAGNALRTFTSISESLDALTFGSTVKTVISVTALVLTFTAPLLGMMLITGEDIAIYMGYLYQAYEGSDYKKAFECCAQIVIGVLFLSLFFNPPAVELIVISLLVAQILMGFYRFAEEYSKGYCIEAYIYFFLSILRMQQLGFYMHAHKERSLQALPPAVQESREIKAILEDSRLYEHLNGALIDKIERTDGGYWVDTPTDRFFVQVHYLPSKVIGPAQFELIFPSQI